MQKYPKHVRAGNWNLMDLVGQKAAGDLYREQGREQGREPERHVGVRTRIARVTAMAADLFVLLNESDLTSDERTAARQVFNVLFDRLGDK
jgi:hypothetical protein